MRTEAEIRDAIRTLKSMAELPGYGGAMEDLVRIQINMYEWMLGSDNETAAALRNAKRLTQEMNSQN